MKPNSPSLVELQQGFRSLIQPESTSQRLPSRVAVPLVDFINETTQLVRKRRIEIYTDAYHLRLTRVLMKVYPTVFRSLGTEVFNLLARRYIQKCPSQGYRLASFGSQLSIFLSTETTDPALPWLSDLAQLEWALFQSSQARIASSTDLSWVTSVSEERWQKALFVIDATVQLLQCEWPVDNLWGSREKDTRPVMKKYPVRVLVTSLQGQETLERLNTSQYRILQWMQKGLSLSDMSRLLQETIHDAEIHSESIQHGVSRWIRNGVIRDIQFPS